MTTCTRCGLLIDKAVVCHIDGIDLPIVMSVKDETGIYHYPCWQGGTPMHAASKDFVVVPREPTEAMLKCYDAHVWLIGPYYEREARRVWQSMIEAYENEPATPAAAAKKEQ